MKKVISAVLAVMMLLTVVQGATVFAEENTADPVIDWRADIAGKRLTDSGTGGVDIDLSGNANWSDAGTSFGTLNGITFSAGNAVTVNDTRIWDAINESSGVTISAVVKATGAGGTIFKITPTNAALGLYITNGKVRVEARSQNGDAWTAYETTNAVLDYGASAGWHRVDVTFDYANKIIKFYTDNKLCETKDATNWGLNKLSYTPSDKYSVNIGNTTIVLAQLRLYNCALTQEEITGRFEPVWSCDFDEVSEAPAEIADTSGYGLNLTVTGEAAAVPGMLGKSVRFADNHASNTDTLSLNKRLDGAEAVTVSFWQKYAGESDPTGYVFDLKGGGNSLIALKPTKNNTFVMVRSYGAKVENVAENSNWTNIATTSGLGDGAWHHILFEADYANGSATLYQDGVQIDAISELNTHFKCLTAATTAQLHIGDPNVLLDNVKVYSGALTATQREALLAEHPMITVKMIDADGSETDKVQEMSKLVCTITNMKSTDLHCALVGAGYGLSEDESELLLGVDAKNDITVAANGWQTIELAGVAAANIDKVSVFLLDSLDTLRPLEEPRRF